MTSFHVNNTAASFTSDNTVLPEDYFGYETDTGRIKRGNGLQAWTDLVYTGKDAIATWYTATASSVGLLQLLIAAYVGAGSHVYTYSGSNLTSDAWTLLGTTRTKTYTWSGTTLVAESDWV